MIVRDSVSPKPIAVLIPSTIVPHTEFREDVLVKEECVSLKITQVHGKLVWCKSFGLCLRQEHGLGCLTGNGAIVKVNGVVMLVLERYHDYGVAGHFLINCYVNAQEEGNKEQAYYDNRDYF